MQDGVGVLGGRGQHGDRLCRGHDDQIDPAAAGLSQTSFITGSAPSAPVPITSLPRLAPAA
jgi:hypothetical protein